MGEWENFRGLTDDYYTPPDVLDRLGVGVFDMDVSAAFDPTKAFVKASRYISELSLLEEWSGFVWCNPPYGARGEKMAWVQKMIGHNNGLMLMPDRTSADWWQTAANNCDGFLTVFDKIKFVKPDGSIMSAPANGSCIFAFGDRAYEALVSGEHNGLGLVFKKQKIA